MKTIRHLLHIESNRREAFIGIVALLTAALFLGAPDTSAQSPAQQAERRDRSAIETGSGDLYRTTVEQHTEGALSAQDLHQVSLLTSRVVGHLNEAVQDLLDQNPDAAKREIEQGLKLSTVVREILPVTTLTTVVRDAGGKEVYRDVDTVQNDRIRLHEGMIAVEVVQPIIDARERDATVKGLRLADAQVIYTSVLADLGYIERKLKRAAALLEAPEDALAQLALAQTRGVAFVTNPTDHPLVEVQQALRLAERMVEEGKHEAARDNLQLAQMQLGIYRSLLGPEAARTVKQLEDAINALMPKVEDHSAAGKIRGFWEQTVSWFREEPGQAHVVEDNDTPDADDTTERR